jgi:hypothetical protein
MQRSLFDHRVNVAWVLRSSGHVALALRGTGGGGTRIVRAAGWVTWDRLQHAWQVRDRQPRILVRSALDLLEIVVLTRSVPADLDAARRVQACNVVVPAMETGYRLGAGTEAVPVVDPSRPFPPRRDQFAVVGLEGVARVLLPHLAVHGRFRRRGLRLHPFEGVWALGMLGGQFGLARYRDRLHRGARRQWWDRAEAQVLLEQRAAAAQAALASNPAHDFKKHLTLLGVAGSERARLAAGEQADHPRQVLERSQGTTLLWAALGIPVEPPELAATWISEDQRRVLDARIDAIDDEMDDAADEGPPLRLDVVTLHGTRVHLRYRGADIHLANPAPQLEAALDPVSLSLVVGAGWKLLNALDPELRIPLRYVLPGVLGDLAVAAVCERGRRCADARRFTWAVVGSLATSIVCDAGLAAAGPLRPPQRTDAVPATAPALGSLAMIGTCEGHVAPWLTGVGIAGTVGKWLLMARVVDPRSRDVVVRELLSLWQGWAAPRGLAASTAAESSALETSLQEGFQEAVRSARGRAMLAEVERAEQQVDLVEVELARLREDLDPELGELVGEQCRELRSWIREQREAIASTS